MNYGDESRTDSLRVDKKVFCKRDADGKRGGGGEGGLGYRVGCKEIRSRKEARDITKVLRHPVCAGGGIRPLCSLLSPSRFVATVCHLYH